MSAGVVDPHLRLHLERFLAMMPIDLIHYLLEQNILSFDSVVDGDVVVSDTSSRNQNYKVIRRENPGLFIKQASSMQQQAPMTLNREATFYQVVSSDDTFASLREYLPVFYSFDKEKWLLVVELFTDSLNLRQYHNALHSFPLSVGRLLGRALACCHAVKELPPPLQNVLSGTGHFPWVLSADYHRQTARTSINPAAAELLDIISQYEEFDELLGELRQDWNPRCLTHGDIKWDNCIAPPTQKDDIETLKIIDWETFAYGDPGWDVGSVFHAYLSYWVWSMSAGQTDTANLIQSARYPIEAMQPAIRAFWDTYCTELGLDASSRHELLIHSNRYSGARLIQTAYESMYGASQLNEQTIYLIQLSVNILTDPQEAAEVLLGITP